MSSSPGRAAGGSRADPARALARAFAPPPATRSRGYQVTAARLRILPPLHFTPGSHRSLGSSRGSTIGSFRSAFRRSSSGRHHPSRWPIPARCPTSLLRCPHPLASSLLPRAAAPLPVPVVALQGPWRQIYDLLLDSSDDATLREVARQVRLVQPRTRARSHPSRRPCSVSHRPGFRRQPAKGGRSRGVVGGAAPRR